jgi:putative oxidoreductase
MSINVTSHVSGKDRLQTLDPTRTHEGIMLVGRAATAVVRTDSDIAPMIARIVLGAVMFPHGAQHLVGWFGGYGFAGTHAWMTGALGFPGWLSALAIVTEFVAPLALVAGIGGRVAALGIAGIMTGAAATHVQHGFFMNWFGTLPAGAEGFEYHILALALALVVVLKGSGAWSVDHTLAGGD